MWYLLLLLVFVIFCIFAVMHDWESDSHDGSTEKDSDTDFFND